MYKFTKFFTDESDFFQRGWVKKLLLLIKIPPIILITSFFGLLLMSSMEKITKASAFTLPNAELYELMMVMHRYLVMALVILINLNITWRFIDEFHSINQKSQEVFTDESDFFQRGWVKKLLLIIKIPLIFLITSFFGLFFMSLIEKLIQASAFTLPNAELYIWTVNNSVTAVMVFIYLNIIWRLLRV